MTARPDPTQPALRIRDLTVHFRTPEGESHATESVSYDVMPGEIVGVVGESGSGKTVTVMAALGLLPRPPARVIAGRAEFEGTDLLGLTDRELARIRGAGIGVVFQDPMTSFNPVITIGDHLAEALRLHDRSLTRHAMTARAVELLRTVGIPEPESRLRQYPHEFSGGMRQRVMFAIAIANRPRVLIADEPTTALDVSIQAQLLDVLREAQRQTQAATVLITHDLGVVAEVASRVVVMYAGRVVETGSITDVFHRPRHPYTQALLASLPRLDAPRGARLRSIPGQPPDPLQPSPGCAFAPRCTLRRDDMPCEATVPPMTALSAAQSAACHLVVGVSVAEAREGVRP